MPWMSTFDPINQRIYTRVSGSLTYQGAVAHRNEIAANPEFNPTYSHILDLSDVDHVELTADDVMRLAQQSVFRTPSRQAIVARTDVAFGISRMYDAYREQCPRHEEITVCRSLVEAYARLDC